MIDVALEVRNAISESLPPSAGVGTRIYAGLTLPATYKPTDGPAVLVRQNGGSVDYSARRMSASVQVECYGIDDAVATATDVAVARAIGRNKRICKGYCRLDTAGVLLEDPETQWRFVLSYYNATVIL